MMAKSDNGDLNISSSAPDTNDPNYSFMKKVTKHVSGLLPSSLSKWFGSNERDSIVRRRISTDEDEDEESLQVQPPKKRARLPSDFSTTNNFTFTSSTPLVNSRTDLRHLQPGPSGYNRHLTSTGTQADPMHLTPIVIVNGDDNSDSDDSASECNPVPQKKNNETLFGFDTPNQPQISKTALNKPLNTSSRSLFSEHSLNPKRACMSARRPSFNASTFGSPNFVDRTLSTNRAVNSPFYGMRTIYGGASAYRKNRVIFPRDESNNIAVKNSVQVKPVNVTKADTMHLSKTARLIYDVLDSFSTPVSDARKIPPVSRPLDQTASTSRSKTPYSREDKTSSTKQLIVPVVPDLLKMKMKERLQDSTVQVRKVATTSKSVLNSEYTLRREEESKPQKHVSKIRTKVASVRYQQLFEAGIIDAVQLPEVQLPITNLPKFDFTLPPPQSFIKPAETIKKLPEAIKTKGKTTSTSQYKFADPIIICTPSKMSTSINKFKFSEPLSSTTSKRSTVSSTIPTITFKTFESNTSPKKKDGQKNNGQNSELVFTLQPPKELVQGSVMDILGKPDKKEEKTENLMDKFKPAAGTWECTQCMIRNIPSATRCVACEALKEPPKKVEQTATGSGNKFKIPADERECSACMVCTNNSSTKCIACTTAKPGAKPAATPPPAPTSGNFGDKFKLPSGSWECSACLIRNKEDATKCVCCEAARPGTKTTTNSLVLPPDTKQTSGFTDFIQKQQAVGEGLDRNHGADVKYQFGIDKTSAGFKFETAKSNTPPPPTIYTFGVKPDKPGETKPTISTAVTTTTGFTFGIPVATKSEVKNIKTSSQTSIFSTKPVVSTISPSNTEPAKTQTVTFASVNTVSSNTTTTSAAIFSFGTAVTSTQNSTPKSTFSFGVISTAPATTTTFSAPVTKSLNMFNSPTTTSVASIFGNTTTTAATTNDTNTAVSVVTSTTAPSSTFSFEAPSQPKPVFAAGKSIPVQFNFGASGLPFSTVPAVSSTTAVSATSTGSSTTTVPSTTSTGVQKSQPFVFNFGNNATATPVTKSEVKPFSFAASELPEKSAFSFTPCKNVIAPPLAKAPMFFGAGATTETNAKDGFGAVTTTSSTFEFGAAKGETSAFGTVSSSSTTSVFNSPAQNSTPQNGGFNFGASTSSPNFNFSSNASAAPAAMFAFGTGQAVSGSGTPGAGVFTFGGASATTSQQAPAFSPDLKPNFNFTGSAAPNFTAPTSWSPAPGMAARRTRKAIRRVQPR